MTTKLFSELNLSPELLKAIDKLGFEQASPIQAEAIPVLMSGRDVVGQSQTGSGKTAAFGIPAIEKTDPAQREVQVLILCPTRELAVQVSEEIHKLAFFKRGIHALPIYGGQSYERQFYGLKQGAQIVIGTPGRVMDHMRRGTLRLDKVKMAILDEADVMLNMGFRDDIELILQSVPPARQTVFFSATMPKPIRDLIEKYSREPQTVKMEQKTMTVATVEQSYYEVDRRFKVELLTRLIDVHDLKLGIVFCNTKRMVDDLVDHLNAQGYSADRLHGDMTQMMRDRVMNKFRKSGLEFLVATDVAARGIDVDDVQVVFNYDLPYDAEDYVHRIGRTGRAGRSGMAISFASGREVFQIRHIERFTNTRIQRATVPTLDEVEQARANVFLGKLRATLASGEFKGQEPLVERLLEEGFTSTDVAAAALHQLQQGEAAAARPPAQEEERPRFDAPPFRGGRGRDDDRGGDRRGPRPERGERFDRGGERRGRFDDRPPRREFERRDDRERPPRREFQPAAEGPARKKFVPREARPQPAAPAVPAAPAAPASAPMEQAPAPAPAVERARRGYESNQAFNLEETEVPPPHKRHMDKPRPSPKHSRRTPENMTRLYMNLGEEMGVRPADVVGAIAGETGLPAKVVGTIDIRERHLFVDVTGEHANSIISKLNRTQIKGNKVKVKLA